MEHNASRRGMRVLCPIHTPDPAPPTDEAVPSEAGLPEAAAPAQRHTGCQGNQVFDTAIARDLAGCSYAAYHSVRGDPAVRLLWCSLADRPSWRRALACLMDCTQQRIQQATAG